MVDGRRNGSSASSVRGINVSSPRTVAATAPNRIPRQATARRASDSTTPTKIV